MLNLLPMIEAHNLRRNFGDVEAVAGVSFEVHPGEIFGLLGPNGAGKTTAIRLLTDQIDPNGGQATVAGCDVVKDRQKLKGLIGVIFQEQNLYDRMTVFYNLRFNCWLYNLSLDRIDTVLMLVQLQEAPSSGFVLSRVA
jgi:ABC-2 type transport system ATP-binding protein